MKILEVLDKTDTFSQEYFDADFAYRLMKNGLVYVLKDKEGETGIIITLKEFDDRVVSASDDQ